ncbi:MAG TPA: M13 family metallopeptidase [Gemmatimonadales bacterium]|nr:M13 family metallopeptidase [Gemmatimonadales bacterium]
MIRPRPQIARWLPVLVLAVAPLAPLRAQRAVPGLDTAGMDRSVRPGDDFYLYANGAWLRGTTIPADRSSYGGFSIANDRAEARLTTIVQSVAAAPAKAGTDLRKIGDYYHSFLDTTAIEARGVEPLEPELNRIAAIGDRTALARYLGATLRADVDPINNGNIDTDDLFGLWVAQDFDAPTQYSAYLLQGGLEMPDRSYYLDTSAAMAGIRTQYREHVARMLALAGFAAGAGMADTILDLETKIARVQESREDSYDVLKGNNHWARAEFASRAPGLDWEAFLGAAGLGDVATFVAWQPGAIAALSALTASEPLSAWKALLAYHAIEHHAAVLPPAFDHEAFAFFGQTLSGTPEQEPRARRAVQATSGALGFAVGHRYAQVYFPPAAKRQAEAMVANLIAAFHKRIARLAWMAAATRAAAQAKLATLRVSVGYPDRWPSYAGLDVVAGRAYENADRVERFEYARAIAKLRKPVDRSEWVMTPQTVNAVNMPAMNALNFPAAILEPPFFDPHRPAVMNYAAIGAVIGHEISHSFDNLGSTFDARGRMRNWWTPDDSVHFAASTEALARQYDAYRPFPGLSINGRLTLSENIADLAGLTAAYDAYRASLGGKEAPAWSGFRGDQEFFLSFAQAWRTKYRDPALRRRLLTDPHSPGPWRARTVRNLDAWYRAFGIEPSDSLYLPPDRRVRIW